MATQIWSNFLIRRLAAISGITTVIVYRIYDEPCYANGPRASGKLWDSNWDGRDPAALVKQNPHTDAAESKCAQIQKHTPKAYRNIFVIRDGQYNTGGGLTAIGKKQACLTGNRMKELLYQYNKIIHTSNSAMGLETAKIIAKSIAGCVQTDDLLCEGIAIEPDPPMVQSVSGGGDWEDSASGNDGPRLEHAFRKYFHRADVESANDTYDILVCPTNVIRYFICRALQFPPEAWIRFNLNNCSITWFLITADGKVRIKELGVVGHLQEHVTEG